MNPYFFQSVKKYTLHRPSIVCPWKSLFKMFKGHFRIRMKTRPGPPSKHIWKWDNCRTYFLNIQKKTYPLLFLTFLIVNSVKICWTCCFIQLTVLGGLLTIEMSSILKIRYERTASAKVANVWTCTLEFGRFSIRGM